MQFEESLKQRLEFICEFAKANAIFINGSIRKIDKTNMHIKDNNILRLIKRFLKAGILEDGKYIKGKLGTPQGSILSPILANIYMYYVLILWLKNVEKALNGYVEIINYADDMILCFQYENEANTTHYNNGKNIRKVIAKNGGTMPEDLPTPKKSLKQLEKENQKALKKKINKKSIKILYKIKRFRYNNIEIFLYRGVNQ